MTSPNKLHNVRPNWRQRSRSCGEPPRARLRILFANGSRRCCSFCSSASSVCFGGQDGQAAVGYPPSAIRPDCRPDRASCSRTASFCRSLRQHIGFHPVFHGPPVLVSVSAWGAVRDAHSQLRGQVMICVHSSPVVAGGFRNSAFPRIRDNAALRLQECAARFRRRVQEPVAAASCTKASSAAALLVTIRGRQIRLDGLFINRRGRTARGVTEIGVAQHGLFDADSPPALASAAGVLQLADTLAVADSRYVAAAVRVSALRPALARVEAYSCSAVSPACR